MKRLIVNFLKRIDRIADDVHSELYIFGQIVSFLGVIIASAVLYGDKHLIGAAVAWLVPIGFLIINIVAAIILFNANDMHNMYQHPDGQAASGLLYLVGTLLTVTGIVYCALYFLVVGIAGAIYYVFGEWIPRWLTDEKDTDD